MTTYALHAVKHTVYDFAYKKIVISAVKALAFAGFYVFTLHYAVTYYESL